LPGAGIVFTNHDGVIPDVLWISNERLAVLLDDAGHLSGAPELVVEVLSPGAANERRDREVKRNLYSAFGVEEYWLLDWRIQTRTIYRREQLGTLTGSPQPAPPYSSRRRAAARTHSPRRCCPGSRCG
jgi:Uma2 family endonuclease